MHDYTSGCTVILTTGPSLPVAVELEIHGKTAPISIQIHNFLSLCPPPQISTVESMTPQLTLGTRISGGHRPEIKKNGFQNAFFPKLFSHSKYVQLSEPLGHSLRVRFKNVACFKPDNI